MFKYRESREGIVSTGAFFSNGVVFVGCFFFVVLLLWKLYLCLNVPFAEIREMANAVAVESAREGVLSDLTVYPYNIYLYGSLQARLLALIPGSLDALLMNRIFSMFCLLASSCVLLLTIHKALDGLGRKMSALAYLFIYCVSLMPHLYNLPLTLGTPNYFGLMICNLILYVGIREHRWKVCVCLPILVVCAFLTKQYFLFSLSYVFFSFLFIYEDNRKWVKLVVCCTLSLLGVLVSLCDVQTKYAFYHQAFYHDDYVQSIERMIRRFFGFFLMTLPIYWYALKKMLMPNVWGNLKNVFNCEVICRCFRSKYATSYNKRMQIFATTIFLLAVVVMIKLGQHTGAISIIYYAQLLTVPLIFLFVVSFPLQKMPSLDRCVTFGLIGVLSFFLFVQDYGKLNVRYSYSPDVQAIYDDINDDSLKVLGCTMTSYIQRTLGKGVDDNGLSCYMQKTYSIDDIDNELHKQSEQYTKTIKQQIKERKFDVIYTDIYSYVTPKYFPELPEYYHVSDSINVANSEVLRWIRK